MVAIAYISARREYDLCDLRKLLIASVLLPQFCKAVFYALYTAHSGFGWSVPICLYNLNLHS